MSNIDVYRNGIGYCSICVPKDMPIKEVESQVNISNPTGIARKWKIAKEDFKTGESNPCPCNKDPDNRLHYLMEC